MSGDSLSTLPASVMLGDRMQSAMTIVISEIYDEAWLLEIGAIAVA